MTRASTTHSVSLYFPILITVLLLGFALRLVPWRQNRFLEDEALYAYWGLQIATGANPLLDQEPVDKPPLFPYALAMSLKLLAPRAVGTPNEQEASHEPTGLEALARLPNLLASVISIALAYALGKQLFQDEAVGLMSAVLVALSPFEILFASTAFTDPLLVTFVLGALLAAAKGHLGVAGLLSGLAAATKQQGLFFLPLVVAVGWLKTTESRNWRLWLRFLAGFALVAAGVLWWDQAREQRPGFIAQSLISYGGLELTQATALSERARDWLSLLGYFWVSSWFNVLVLAGLGLWLVGGMANWWTAGTKIDLVICLFILCFLGLHWLVAFQVWDRYLLGLIPLVALLTSRASVAIYHAMASTTRRKVYAFGLAAVLVALLTGPAIRATQSEFPVGSDHGAYDGIDKLAGYLRTQVPRGSVVYHHWLGYHYRFYLYGAPLRLHWYPNLDDLAHDATVYRREPRYIAFASWHDTAPVEKVLSDAGVMLAPVLETTRRDSTTSFRLYRLDGP